MAIPINSIIIIGLISGVLYSLLALGFTLIYGVAEVVNMAHGAFFMIGAYTFFSFLMFLGFNPEPPITRGEANLLPPAIILATVVVAIVGVLIYRFLINPIEEDPLASIVVTIFIAMIIEQIIYVVYGGHHPDVPSGMTGFVTIWGVTVTNAQIVGVIVSITLFVLLSLFLLKSKLGTAMRAVAQERDAAMLVGINTTRLYALTMFIAAALAALAGIFVVSSRAGTAEPGMWLNPLGMSFAIVILGGLGSVKGTFVASIIIGLCENAVALSVPEGSYLRGAVALAVMVAVLLIRPRGLFGKHIEMEE